MVERTCSFIILYFFYNIASFTWFCTCYSHYTFLCQLILLEILMALEMVFGMSVLYSGMNLFANPDYWNQ